MKTLLNAEQRLAYRALRIQAMSEVTKAIYRRELRPVQTYNCVDCGAKAQAYDHRDYFEPLVVAPVCIGCNHKRGMATTTIEKLLAGASVEIPASLRDREANSTTITLRIDSDLFAAIEKQSREQDRSYTWIINNLLRRQLAPELPKLCTHCGNLFQNEKSTLCGRCQEEEKLNEVSHV